MAMRGSLSCLGGYVVTNDTDKQSLQGGLDKLVKWSEYLTQKNGKCYLILGSVNVYT